MYRNTDGLYPSIFGAVVISWRNHMPVIPAANLHAVFPNGSFNANLNASVLGNLN